MIPKCPYCGQQDFVYRNIRRYGWAQEYFDLEGQLENLDLDHVRSVASKTLRCAFCGRVRRDLIITTVSGPFGATREIVQEKT